MSAATQPAIAVTTMYREILDMTEDDLAQLRSALRQRHTRREIISQLNECAERLAATPTMREFANDPQTTVHPQTIVERFGTWNAGVRAAGLVPRRGATRDELIVSLQTLAAQLGRTPVASDFTYAGPRVAGKAVYVRMFGSLNEALRAAGFDAPESDEKLERSIEHGVATYARLGRMPSFREWDALRGRRNDVLSAWQIYRGLRDRGAWRAFQDAIAHRVGCTPALVAA